MPRLIHARPGRHQVAPAELEALLLTHPLVVDVGVIGVWSEEERTEVPRAYVVRRADEDAHEEGSRAETSTFSQDVQGWVRDRVSFALSSLAAVVGPPWSRADQASALSCRSRRTSS